MARLAGVEARYGSVIRSAHERTFAENFEKRIAIVCETRRFFEERGFLEVETRFCKRLPVAPRPNI